jgi:hypothetical protein
MTKRLGGKSWTGYAKATIAPFFLGCVAALFLDSQYWFLGTGLTVVGLLYLLHRILFLRSYRFYMDDIGIWVCSGYLPWSKGVMGVKWRDLDMAVYYPNFLSWLCCSYSLRVQHRYSRASGIYLTGMHRGNVATCKINTVHQEKILAGTLS